MSRFARCETCRREAPLFTRGAFDGWFSIHEWSAGRDDDNEPDFCSLKCLADYVTARLLIPADGDSGS